MSDGERYALNSLYKAGIIEKIEATIEIPADIDIVPESTIAHRMAEMIADKISSDDRFSRIFTSTDHAHRSNRYKMNVYICMHPDQLVEDGRTVKDKRYADIRSTGPTRW